MNQYSFENVINYVKFKTEFLNYDGAIFLLYVHPFIKSRKSNFCWS